ncbi:MAG: hypothetical protein QOG62_739 [Thermoleophilaceae bacterium]|jgi:hypothetical protein|nr:hypothetical protein [Thermoleophilaceae bacterium]
MRTAREQADARREEKLAEVRRQMRDGTLKVRKMTKAEMKEAQARREARAAA